MVRDWFADEPRIPRGFATDWPGDPLATLRAPLTTPEIERYRALGLETSSIMEAVLKSTRRGDSELEVAGTLRGLLAMRGIQAPVVLAAVDRRIEAHRHPLPGHDRLEKKLMLVVCAERHGLVVAMTRLLSFGRLDADLQRRHAACAEVESAMHRATRAGTPLADVFASAVAVYRDMGFDGEWCFHHQGGPIGYHTRDAIARPGGSGVVLRRAAYAWNPSITGTKCEDTLLEGGEVLTPMVDWPKDPLGNPGWLIRRG